MSKADGDEAELQKLLVDASLSINAPAQPPKEGAGCSNNRLEPKEMAQSGGVGHDGGDFGRTHAGITAAKRMMRAVVVEFVLASSGGPGERFYAQV